MFRLGLTGSIGMGKSTTGKLFEDEGCALWDADAAVHRIYKEDGPGPKALGPMFPHVVIDGAVSREALKKEIAQNSEALSLIEKIVHPLVRQDREKFSKITTKSVCVFDIPLLFETGSEAEFDAVACVYVSEDIQTERVLARGTMTLDQLSYIRSRQMSVEDKLERSQYRIHTDTLEHAKQQVQHILQDIKQRIP